MSQTTTKDRFRGCLLGLATGDALGTTLEFRSPGSFHPIDDVIGGGPFDLEPGQWTDDTSMALCLAASLIETGHFDPEDQMQRYVRWWEEGYMSSTGTCFDIGNTIADALWHFTDSGDPYAGSTDPFSAGNGSLMRLAPVPMCYAGNAAEAVAKSADSSRTTHGASGSGRCLPLLRWTAYCCFEWGGQRNAPFLLVFTTARSLGKKSFGGEGRRGSNRILQASRTTRNQGNRLRCRINGGGALGVPQVPELPRRCPSCRQPRRRRRHHCCNLWTDRWGPLWSRGNSI